MISVRRCIPRALTALLAAALAVAAPIGEDAELQLRFADGLMARGMHEHAIREYLFFLERHPDYTEMDVIHFRIGECYRHLNNPAAAVRSYRRVIQEHPGSAYRHRAMFRQADVFRGAGQPAIAARLLRELLEEQPDAALADTALYWLGFTLAAAGERDEAAAVLRDFLGSGRETAVNAPAALDLAKLLAEGDAAERAEAVRLLTGVTRQPPDGRTGAEALFHLARLAEGDEDFERAARLYDDFLERHGDDSRAAEARPRAAWTYYRVGRYADSLRLCAAAIAESSRENGAAADIGEWLYLKANNRRRLGEHAAAAEAYGRMLAMAPDSPLAAAAALEKAQSELETGDYAGSLQSMRRVRPEGRSAPLAYWILASAHEAAGADSDAVQNYRLILERFPESDQAYAAAYRLGVLFQRRNDARQAALHFQRVAEDYADRSMAPPALLAAAEALRSIGQYSEAVRDYTRFLQRYPDHELAEEALFRKAEGETLLNRKDAALRSFQDFRERFPESARTAEAAYRLGLLHLQAGAYRDAEAEFARALAVGPAAALRPSILRRRAETLRILDRDSEAAAIFRDLLGDARMEHFGPSLLEWLSVHLRSEQRFTDAIRAADRLVERAGGQVEWLQAGHTLAGLAAAAAGDAVAARTRLEAALATPARTPYAAEAAVFLGERDLEANAVAEARRRFRQAAEYAQDPALLHLRARALIGLGASEEADANLAEAARYYTLVGLTFDVPEWSETALRKAAATYEKMGRPEDRDGILSEIEERYGVGTRD